MLGLRGLVVSVGLDVFLLHFDGRSVLAGLTVQPVLLSHSYGQVVLDGLAVPLWQFDERFVSPEPPYPRRVNPWAFAFARAVLAIFLTDCSEWRFVGLSGESPD